MLSMELVIFPQCIIVYGVSCAKLLLLFNIAVPVSKFVHYRIETKKRILTLSIRFIYFFFRTCALWAKVFVLG